MLEKYGSCGRHRNGDFPLWLIADKYYYAQAERPRGMSPSKCIKTIGWLRKPAPVDGLFPYHPIIYSVS